MALQVGVLETQSGSGWWSAGTIGSTWGLFPLRTVRREPGIHTQSLSIDGGHRPVAGCPPGVAAPTAHRRAARSPRSPRSLWRVRLRATRV